MVINQIRVSRDMQFPKKLQFPLSKSYQQQGKHEGPLHQPRSLQNEAKAYNHEEGHQRSTRVRNSPTWLSDYVTYVDTSGHSGFLSRIMEVKEPQSYKEAVKDPN